MQNPLDMIHDGARIVTECAHTLTGIARALHRVGMRDLADEIGTMADELHAAEKLVLNGYSLELERGVRAAEQATGNILSTMLAMAGHAKKE